MGDGSVGSAGVAGDVVKIQGDEGCRSKEVDLGGE
jgi:hypothetical protein